LLHGPLVEADVDGLHARVQALHVAAAVRQLDEALEQQLRESANSSLSARKSLA
jgi:hypothetical protein